MASRQSSTTLKRPRVGDQVDPDALWLKRQRAMDEIEMQHPEWKPLPTLKQNQMRMALGEERSTKWLLAGHELTSRIREVSHWYRAMTTKDLSADSDNGGKTFQSLEFDSDQNGLRHYLSKDDYAELCSVAHEMNRRINTYIDWEAKAMHNQLPATDTGYDSIFESIHFAIARIELVKRKVDLKQRPIKLERDIMTLEDEIQSLEHDIQILGRQLVDKKAQLRKARAEYGPAGKNTNVSLMDAKTLTDFEKLEREGVADVDMEG